MKKIDLHTHSTYSDGSMTPSELIKYASLCNLQAIALTDHDTTAGLDEAITAAQSLNIELISGVELACWHVKTELHIVGLFINHHEPEFQQAMTVMQQTREARNLEIIQLMQQANIDITLEKLYATEGCGVLTRANFAHYLKQIGFVSSIKEAFDRYLGDHKPFYLPRDKKDPEYVINLIKKAGGVPILAHPLTYKLGKSTLEKYVSDLKNLGLEGIEVFYSTNTPSDNLYSCHLANRFELKYSGGSDFHGIYKPHIDLGKGKGRLIIPYDILEKLKKGM